MTAIPKNVYIDKLDDMNTKMNTIIHIIEQLR